MFVSFLLFFFIYSAYIHVSDFSCVCTIYMYVFDSRYHHEGHSDECVAVPPLCSGGGPLSDCALCQLHGYYNLPNHSYVNLTLVGNIREGNDSVQCHSDLDTCCGGSGYPDRGDWYFPNGMRLNFNSGTADLYQFHTTHRVDLRRKNSDTSGIYRCTVETNTVHSDDDSDTTARETVYVGLYSSGGKC